jgi:phage baseplate assembly protein W
MPLIKNTPIGITFPIRDGQAGYFEQSTDSFTAYRMNIINLLRTRQGERRMNPTFGSRLWTVLFDQNDDFLVNKIENIIREDVAQWIPGVTVTKVVVSEDQNENRDTYTLHLAVTFVVDSINASDAVQFTIDVNKV